MIQRAFPNLISQDLAATKAWYMSLLDWDVEFESDWFVHIRAAGEPAIELGIIASGHDIVPEGATARGGNTLLTFVVSDVDAVHEVAVGLGHDIVEEPTDLFYGQRRMILRDPTGVFIDISSECEPSQEFLDSLAHRSVHDTDG